MRLSSATKKELERLINGSTHIDPVLKRIAGQLSVMPIFSESAGWYGVNLDGEIVSASWENPNEIRIELNERIQNLVLFQGIRNYPELSDLMPVRKETDEACPDCKGSGVHPLSHLNIGCYCGGLGWVPKN